MILFKNNISPQTKLVVSFFLIVLVHIIFKLCYLTYSGFWYDETFGLHYSLQDWGLIKHTSEWDVNAPLYYYFLWIWRHFFGISEYALRFSSVLFSALAAGVLYIFSYKYFNKTTAIIALLIYTSSNEIFFYSHETRCYSMLFFLTLSSSYFYFKLIEKKSIASIILLGIINFLLIYAHYLTVFILGFQALLVLIFYIKTIKTTPPPLFPSGGGHGGGNNQTIKRVSIAFLITFILAFWRFTQKTIHIIFHHEKIFWLTKPTFNDFKNMWYDFFNTPQIFFFYLILLTAVLIISCVNNKTIKTIPPPCPPPEGDTGGGNNKTLRFLYILLCGVGLVVICFAVSSITPIFFKRYVLYALPFMCILIGFMVSKINNTSQRYIATTLVCLISLYSFSKIDFRTPKHMNYRDAMVFIKQEKTTRTAILIETRDMRDLFAYYYDKAIFLDYYNMDTDLNKESVYIISGIEDLKTIDFTKYDKVIVTQTWVKADTANETFLNQVGIRYKTHTLIKEYEGIAIIVFK